LVHLVGGEVDDLPFALGDEDRFDVVGVPEVVVGAGLQRGLVDGEAHLLPGQDDARTAPVFGLDVILGTGDVIHGANEHVGIPLGVLGKLGLWCGPAAAWDQATGSVPGGGSVQQVGGSVPADGPA